MSRRFVAYYRVRDGYDLRDQVQCVKEHVRNEGGEIIRSYRDEEKGRRPERRELHNALAYAKKRGASLIIATLKGLSRDVHFLRALRDSAIDFMACDLSHANTSTIHVLAALAEYDAKDASDRGKRAFAASKARRVRQGPTPTRGGNLDDEARGRGARKAGRIAKARADEAYRELAPLVKRLRREGLTLQRIADHLNAQGYQTRQGRNWNAMQVSRVLKRRIGGRDASNKA